MATAKASGVWKDFVSYSLHIWHEERLMEMYSATKGLHTLWNSQYIIKCMSQQYSLGG